MGEDVKVSTVGTLINVPLVLFLKDIYEHTVCICSHWKGFFKAMFIKATFWPTRQAMHDSSSGGVRWKQLHKCSCCLTHTNEMCWDKARNKGKFWAFCVFAPYTSLHSATVVYAWSGIWRTRKRSVISHKLNIRHCVLWERGKSPVFKYNPTNSVLTEFPL